MRLSRIVPTIPVFAAELCDTAWLLASCQIPALCQEKGRALSPILLSHPRPETSSIPKICGRIASNVWDSHPKEGALV